VTAQVASTEPTSVYLEVGQKRVFACALAWPGWCRSGRNEEQALDVLAAYAERYAVVAREAGLAFPTIRRDTLQIVERIAGSAGYTDFGAPGAIATSDRAPLTDAEAERQAALVRASWSVLDRVTGATPAELRKGPRGGGRDRDKMVDHILGAEVVYARKLGLKHRQPARDDAPAIAALRADIISALRTSSADPSLAPPGWPPRYAARRIAWHVLDHVWEMEDRSEPATACE
jgi:hypothetical protein